MRAFPIPLEEQQTFKEMDLEISQSNLLQEKIKKLTKLLNDLLDQNEVGPEAEKTIDDLIEKIIRLNQLNAEENGTSTDPISVEEKRIRRIKNGTICRLGKHWGRCPS